jgi:hypothetical protein
MRRYLSAFRSGLVLLLIASAAPAQDSTARLNLQPDWETGQQCRYEISSTRNDHRTLRAGGEQQEMAQTVETTGEVVWRVENARPGGGGICTVDFQWLRVVIETDSERRVNDSRDASGDVEPLHDLLSAYADHNLTVDVAADGSIDDLRGGGAIRAAVPAEELAPSDRDLRQNVTELAPIAGAPSDAASGAQWNVAFTWSHDMGLMHYDATYTVEGVEGIAEIPVVTVGVEADMQLEVEQPDLPAEAPDVDVSLRDSSYESQIIFDLARREAVGRHTTERQVIEQSMRMEGRSMTQTLERQITSQLLRIDEQ